MDAVAAIVVGPLLGGIIQTPAAVDDFQQLERHPGIPIEDIGRGTANSLSDAGEGKPLPMKPSRFGGSASRLCDSWSIMKARRLDTYQFTT